MKEVILHETEEGAVAFQVVLNSKADSNTLTRLGNVIVDIITNNEQLKRAVRNVQACYSLDPELNYPRYCCQFVEAGVPESIHFSLDQVLRKDTGGSHYELFFAIREELRTLVGMKKGESIRFRPNRDNKESMGIITRVD